MFRDANCGGDSTALTGLGNIGTGFGLGVSSRVIFFLMVGMGGGNLDIIEDGFVGGGTLANPGGGILKSSFTDPCKGVIPLVAFGKTPLEGAFFNPNFCLSSANTF